MRKIIGVVLLILMVVGLWAFTKSWRSTSPLGIGTGRIAGTESDLAARDQRGVGTKTRSNFRGILDNPLRYQNKRVTVKGRVHGAGKLAANRNIYTLSEGDDRILVIDDKAPPQDYQARTVSGIVKVVGPPLGGLQYAYVVDTKAGVKFNPPAWQDIKNYFTHSPNG